MKKIAGFSFLAFILIISFVFISNKKSYSDVTVIYHLSESFDGGCVYLRYNEDNEKPLEIVNKELIIEVPENGRVMTSSSSDVLTKLGWHKVKAFYVNENRERTEEIPHEKFLNGQQSSTDNNPLSETYSISFDGRDGHCN
ncbi:DUF6843 domain-containing protein [Bacillus alkalisoli]|uniref:DUF6843 domain-containing protein n=1 Tax=Bacillus alkalisoli TaxID=2011008 RepID=UPI000C239831|nr:hypothetical protein [Bacillus alkalisoli]